MRLNKKYSGLLLVFFMTLFLDTTMTFTMTSIGVGWTADFFNRFLQGWIIGFTVAFPTSLLAIPIARRLVALFVSRQK